MIDQLNRFRNSTLLFYVSLPCHFLSIYFPYSIHWKSFRYQIMAQSIVRVNRPYCVMGTRLKFKLNFFYVLTPDQTYAANSFCLFLLYIQDTLCMHTILYTSIFSLVYVFYINTWSLHICVGISVLLAMQLASQTLFNPIKSC